MTNEEGFANREDTGDGIFPDPNLEQAIREAINKPEGVILSTDLEGLVILDVSDKHIKDITGLHYCDNLTSLSLVRNHIKDISSLAILTNLTELDLTGNQIYDISSLTALTNLTELGLTGNPISDISPLALLIQKVQKSKHILSSSRSIIPSSSRSAVKGIFETIYRETENKAKAETLIGTIIADLSLRTSHTPG